MKRRAADTDSSADEGSTDLGSAEQKRRALLEAAYEHGARAAARAGNIMLLIRRAVRTDEEARIITSSICEAAYHCDDAAYKRITRCVVDALFPSECAFSGKRKDDLLQWIKELELAKAAVGRGVGTEDADFNGGRADGAGVESADESC